MGRLASEHNIYHEEQDSTIHLSREIGVAASILHGITLRASLLTPIAREAPPSWTMARIRGRPHREIPGRDSHRPTGRRSVVECITAWGQAGEGVDTDSRRNVHLTAAS